MLLIFLFVLLCLVIVFRNEIKNLIAYGILTILAAGLWQVAWWGKLIVIILGICLILGLVAKGIEFFRGRGAEKRAG
jgi:hypothetical protein